MSRKVAVRASVRLRVYPVVEEAVDAACLGGVRRFWKHRELPPGWTDEMDGTMASQVRDYVMSALSEIVDWGDAEE